MKVSVFLRPVTHQGDYVSPCGDTRLLQDHSEIPATAAPSSHLGGLVHPLAGLLKEWSTAVSIPESPGACAKHADSRGPPLAPCIRSLGEKPRSLHFNTVPHRQTSVRSAGSETG